MPTKIEEKDLSDKACPYFPPLMLPNKLVPGGVNISYQNCIGKNCAIYESCQGSLSVRADMIRRRTFIAGAIEMLKKVPSGDGSLVPFINAAESYLASLSAALDKDIKTA